MSPAMASCVRHEHPTAKAQARALADAIAIGLSHALKKRGRALLAVSGGRSPLPLFAALRQRPLDWHRVFVVLVDERVVPPDHADSNARLVREHLLQQKAARAIFRPPFDHLPEGAWSDQALTALARQADARLQGLPWPIDIAVLGMGEDGHTASLFAGADGLAQALDPQALDPQPLDDRLPGGDAEPKRAGRWIAWIRPHGAPHARLTLTLAALLAARCLVLPLRGAAKRAMFERACQARDCRLPISWLLHDAPRPVQVWLSP